MTLLEWAVVITSVLGGLASVYKGIYDLGIGSVRGRMYAFTGLGLLIQALWILLSYNDWLWVLSRTVIAYGTLQYALPYVLRKMDVLPASKWLLIFALWVAFLLLTVSLAHDFTVGGWKGIAVFILDGATLFVTIWGAVGFWGAEIGYRWLGGSVVAALLWVGDAHVIKGLMFATYGIFTVMNLLMAAVALKRG
ncbi:MAG: hypothetical protein GXO29_04190 [Thermotogae bacterium]|nr:hypothetical protein [Thermotogota bacterium]